MDIEISRRQFFALFARGAHGAKNPKKCRDPCWPPAGVRPCASKERQGGYSDQRGAGVRHGIRRGRRDPPGVGCGPSAVAGLLRGLTTTSWRGRRRNLRLKCRSMNRDGRLSRAACGRYAHEIAGGEMALHMERLRCCATRPLREGVELMLGYERRRGNPGPEVDKREVRRAHRRRRAHPGGAERDPLRRGANRLTSFPGRLTICFAIIALKNRSPRSTFRRVLTASHSEDACGVGFCIHYGCRWLFQGCDPLQLFRR